MKTKLEIIIPSAGLGLALIVALAAGYSSYLEGKAEKILAAGLRSRDRIVYEFRDDPPKTVTILQISGDCLQVEDSTGKQFPLLLWSPEGPSDCIRVVAKLNPVRP